MSIISTRPLINWVYDRTSDGADPAPTLLTDGFEVTRNDLAYWHWANLKNFLSYRLWIYGLPLDPQNDPQYWTPIASARYDATPNTEGMSDIIVCSQYSRLYIRVHTATGVNRVGDLLYGLEPIGYEREIVS